MKKLLLPLFVIILITSCSDQDSFLDQKNESSVDFLQRVKRKDLDNEVMMKNYDQLLASKASKTAQLDNLSFKEGCVKTAVVPDDYSTIQEAIDAVCVNGNVIVKSGTYNENPGIFTPGISVKADGEVLLNGGFGIAADNVTISNFNIDCTTSTWIVGIGVIGNDGIEIKNNNLYGRVHIGIYLSHTNNSSIIQNVVEGPMDYGIMIDSRNPNNGVLSPCKGNKIAENTVSGMQYSLPGIGIFLRGDVDDNMVSDNYVASCLWGISLWWWHIGDNVGDNNTIKNNVSERNYFTGIEIGMGGSSNTIGPNNTANNNGLAGIVLYDLTNNNHVFNNTAFNNTAGYFELSDFELVYLGDDLDIVNFGTDNTFKNNKAENTYGVD